MAHRTVTRFESFTLPREPGAPEVFSRYEEIKVQRSYSVEFYGTTEWPITVKAPGINTMQFQSLQAVYEMFGNGLTPLQLDYNGNKVIMECVEELGFVRPSGHLR